MLRGFFFLSLFSFFLSTYSMKFSALYTSAENTSICSGNQNETWEITGNYGRQYQMHKRGREGSNTPNVLH